MAFSFVNAGSSGFGAPGASSNAQTQTGPDLEEIQTEVILHDAAVSGLTDHVIGSRLSFPCWRGKDTITPFTLA